MSFVALLLCLVLFSLLSTIYSSKGCQVFALGSPFGSCKFCKYFHKKNQINKPRLHILDTQMDVQKKSLDLLKTRKLFQQIAMLEAIGNVFADHGSRKHLHLLKHSWANRICMWCKIIFPSVATNQRRSMCNINDIHGISRDDRTDFTSKHIDIRWILAFRQPLKPWNKRFPCFIT